MGMMLSIAPPYFHKTGYGSWENNIELATELEHSFHINHETSYLISPWAKHSTNHFPTILADKSVNPSKVELELFIKSNIIIPIEPDIFCCTFRNIQYSCHRIFSLGERSNKPLPILEYARSYEQSAIGDCRKFSSNICDTITNNASPEYPDLLITSAGGSFNYGHWLVDDLPRIAMVLENAMRREDPGMIPSNIYTFASPTKPEMGKVIKESLEWLIEKYYFIYDRIKDSILRDGLKDKLTKCNIFILNSAENYRFTNISLITPTSLHPILHNAKAINAINSISQQLKKNSQSPKKIFIARRKTGNRRIKNQREVRKLVAQQGYKKIYCEDLNFIEQANLFAGATHVIGTMGASMCNLIFSSSKIKPVFLTPVSWKEPFYASLCNSLGMESVYTLNKTSGREKLTHQKDIQVDLEILNQAIKHT